MRSNSISRFDQQAHTYQAHAKVQREFADWLAEWLPMTAEATALELGAGSGFFTRHATRAFSTLVASDISPRMIAEGQKECPGARWTLADAWNLAIEPGQFDAILSASLLQWCPQPTQIMEQWRKLLRKGDSMLHGFYIAPTLPELATLLDAEMFPFAWKTAEDWECDFRAAGFEISRAEKVTRVFHHSSSMELLRDLHRSGAVGNVRMPPGALRFLLNEYDIRFGVGTEGGVYSSWTFYRIETRVR